MPAALLSQKPIASRRWQKTLCPGKPDGRRVDSQKGDQCHQGQGYPCSFHKSHHFLFLDFVGGWTRGRHMGCVICWVCMTYRAFYTVAWKKCQVFRANSRTNWSTPHPLHDWRNHVKHRSQVEAIVRVGLYLKSRLIPSATVASLKKTNNTIFNSVRVVNKKRTSWPSRIGSLPGKTTLGGWDLKLFQNKSKANQKEGR